MNLKTEIAPGLCWGIVAARVRNVYSILLLALVVTAALPTVGRTQDFLFSTEAGKITITGRTENTATTVNIPASIGGLPVTAIGSYAFSGDHLTSVTIPNSVTTIEDDAFDNCSSLTDITIGNGVKRIGGFYGCTGLTSITIPNGVTSIAGFVGCTSLTSVTIPNSITTIGFQAFSSCTGLTNVTIPNGVTSVGSAAFTRCTGLTSVTIPNSVTNIGGFGSCTGLTSVTIPNGVTTIEIEAFSSCTGLTNVTIPNGVTSIGYFAFKDCTGLTSLTIPNSVTTIWDGAFYGCTGLKGVYFLGDAPSLTGDETDYAAFGGSRHPTFYYLAGTRGWSSTSLKPTSVWLIPNPVILTGRPDFGRQANGFNFRISWATNIPVVVEATTDLAQSVWSPVSTLTLTDGTAYFTDPEWSEYPARLYRVRAK